MRKFESREVIDFSDEPSISVSQLYRIPPPGLDTIDVIALTDYIILLANEHCIPVYILVEKEIVPVINSMLNNSEMPLSGHLNGRGNDGIGINGYENSGKWIRAIEFLTLHSDLHKLTTFSLRRILPGINMFNTTKKWCDECYDDARDHGTPIYDRLLWKFAPVKVCSHHQRILRDRCPFPDCQKALSQLPRNVYAGFCPHCHQWLGKHSTDRLIGEIKLDETTWLAEKRVNTSITDLLQAAFEDIKQFGDQGISLSLRRLRDEAFHNNLSAMARFFGMEIGTLYCNCNQTSRPSLSRVLAWGKALNLSLVQLYTGDFKIVEVNCKPMPSRVRQPLTNGRVPEPQVENALLAELNRVTDKPESIGKISEKMGWSREYLRAHFPLLVDQLQSRWKSYAQTQLEAGLLLNPPQSLRNIAESIDYSEKHLKRIFPDLCKAVMDRYRVWKETRKAIVRSVLKAALEAPVPESVSSIAARLNIRSSTLQHQHPELYKKCVERYTQYVNDQHLEKTALECEMIRQTVFSLHTNGYPYPSRTKIFSSLPTCIDPRNPFHHQAYVDSIQELCQLAESGNESLPE